MGWIANSSFTISNGGRTATSLLNNNWEGLLSDFDKTSGKWYWEVLIDTAPNGPRLMIDVAAPGTATSNYLGSTSTGWGYYTNVGNTPYKYHSSTGVAWGSAFGTDDVIGIAIDVDAGKVWWSLNGVWLESGDPANGTNEAYSGLSATLTPGVSTYTSGTVYTANWTSGDLVYTEPTGFSPLIPLSPNLDSILLTTYGKEIVDDTPYAYWALNDTSDYNDTYNGTLAGTVSPVLVDSITTPSGNAYYFSGESRIELPDALDLDEKASATMEAWIKPTSLSGHQVVFKVGGSTNGMAIGLYNDNFRVGVAVSDVSIFADFSVVGYSTDMPIHIVGVVTGTYLKLYINGVLKTTNTTTIGAHNGACSPSIGNTYCKTQANNNSPLTATAVTANFTGIIDEVSIYDKELTDVEISAHYNANSMVVAGVDVITTGHYYNVILDSASNFWPLNDATGTTAVDVIGTDDGYYYNTPSLEDPSIIASGDDNSTFFAELSNEYMMGDYTSSISSFELTFNVSYRGTTGSTIYTIYESNNDRFLLKVAGGALAISATEAGTETYYTILGNNILERAVHLIVTDDGVDTKFYVDGILVKTLNVAAFSALTPAKHSINSIIWNSAATIYKNASYQYLAYYSSALSQATVTEHYNATLKDTVHGFVLSKYYDISSDGRTVTRTGGGESTWKGALTNFIKSSGKWYWEIKLVDCTNHDSSPGDYIFVEVAHASIRPTTYLSDTTAGWGYYATNGNRYNSSNSSYGATYVTGDVIGIAYDANTGMLWFSKNGTWQASGNPETGVNPAYSNALDYILPGLSTYKLGDILQGNFTANTQIYDVPVGFRAIGDPALDAILIQADSYYSKVLASSPTAYWRLNGDSKEEFGSRSIEYNIKDINRVNTISSDLPSSIEFNGTDAYISSIMPQHSGSWSVELIFKVDSLPTGNILISEQHTGSGDIIPFRIYFGNNGTHPGNQVTLDYHNGSSNTSIYDPATITLGVHHVVGIYDESIHKYILYLDGEQVAISATEAVNPKNDNNLLYIGRRWDSAISPVYFDGVIDSVSIYDSVLSAATVLEHSALGITPVVAVDSVIMAANSYWSKILDANPMAYWRLGEDQIEQYGTDTTYYNTESRGSLVHDNDSSQYFNGTNAYVACVNPQYTTDWSIELIFEIDNLPNGTILLSEQYTGSSEPITWTFNFTNDGIHTTGNQLTIGFYTGAWNVAYDPADITLGKHHAIGIYDSSTSQLFLYLDGAQVATSAIGLPTPINDNNTLYIGRRWDTASPQYFNGIIDEVAIYDEVLSAATILDHALLALAPETYVGSILVTEDRAYFNEVIASVPIGYWRLGEASGTVAIDEVRRAEGEYINSPTLGVPSLLVEEDDSAVTFNGSNQYVNLVDDQLDVVGDITVEAVIKTTNLSTETEFIVCKYNNTAGWFIFVRDGIIQFDVRAGSIYYSSGVGNSTRIDDGQPHHILGIRNGSEVRVYIDGALTTTKTGVSTSSFANTVTAEIGHYWSGDTYHFDGTVDEVAIYDKALTTEEIYLHSSIAIGHLPNIDAVLYVTDASLDGILDAKYTNIDATLSLRIENEIPLDAHLEKNVSITSNIDVIAALHQEIDIPLDVITDAMNATIDSSLQLKDIPQVTDIGSVLYGPTYILPPVDAFLKGSINKVSSIYAILQAEVIKTTDIVGTLIPATGVWCQLGCYLEISTTSRINGYLKLTDSKTISIDALLAVINSKTLSVDTVLREIYSIGASIDAHLEGAEYYDISVDASLQGNIPAVTDIGSLLILKQESTADIHALLENTEYMTTDITVIMLDYAAHQFSIDSVLNVNGPQADITVITTPLIIGERDVWHYTKGVITEVNRSDSLLTSISEVAGTITKVSYIVGIITKVSNEVNI